MWLKLLQKIFVVRFNWRWIAKTFWEAKANHYKQTRRAALRAGFVLKINTKLIESAIEDNHLSELAVFIRLKTLYNNSCTYGSSYKNLALKSGISQTKLRKTIPFLKEKGWVRVHSGNLVFVPLGVVDTCKKRRMSEIKINRQDSYKTIQKKLRLSLLKRVHDGFLYIQNLSRDIKKRYQISKREYNKRKKIRKISESARFSMSNTKIGRMIERSKSTGSRLVKWARENKMLVTEEHLVPVSDPNGVYLDENHLLPGYFISKHGIMKRMSNFISFI